MVAAQYYVLDTGRGHAVQQSQQSDKTARPCRPSANMALPPCWYCDNNYDDRDCLLARYTNEA